MSAAARRQNWIYRQILEKKPTKVYLGLGSNLGDREKNLRTSLDILGSLPDIQILKVSSLYETEPVECDSDLWFLNQAAYLVTLLPLRPFFNQLREVEQKLGKTEKRKREPRVIDLDILFFGDRVHAESDLQVPHPRLHQRRFVLEPLCELHPQLWHPICQKSIEQLLDEAPNYIVRRYAPAAI